MPHSTLNGWQKTVSLIYSPSLLPFFAIRDCRFGFNLETAGPCLYYSKWGGTSYDDIWYLVVGGTWYPLSTAGQGADEVVAGTISLDLDANTITGTISGDFGTISATQSYTYISGIDKVLVASDVRYGPAGVDVDNIVVTEDGSVIYSEDFNGGTDSQDISKPPFDWLAMWGESKDIRISDDTAHNTSVPNDHDVVVGSSNAGGEDFVGDIDFVRVSAEALTPGSFIKDSRGILFMLSFFP